MAAIDSQLTVDKEFESLCPKLTEEEQQLLSEAIERDGCRDPIVTWANHDDTIVDGYNRYRICRKLGIGFKTKAMSFASRAEVVNWIVKNQIGRRNLNEAQRAMLAAHMVTTSHGGDRKTDQAANLQLETTAKAAEICKVSPRSVADAKKVIADGSPALKKAVQAGEVPISSAAAIVELPKAEQTKAVKNGTVSAVAKEVKEAKKYNDKFDPSELDKQKPPKNGAVKFDAKPITDMFGKIARAIDRYEAEVGGAKGLHKKALSALNEAIKAWKELTSA